MKPIPFKFSLLPGDLINAMAGIKHVCDHQNTKADIYLGLNIEIKMAAELKIGRKSPYTLTQESMDFLKPLLLSQPYINSVQSLEEHFPEIYHGWCDLFTNFDQGKLNQWYRDHRGVIIDLDQNHCVPIGLPAGNLFRSNFYVYPDMACDLSLRWLHYDEPSIGLPHPTVIVNRTLRCRNKKINYKFLKDYHVAFIGHKDEFDAFCEESELPGIAYLECQSARDIMQWLAMAKVFVGNQSLCYSIAEAMKIPRVLEIAPGMNNVIPAGPNGYDVWFQPNMEYYVEELMRR